MRIALRLVQPKLGGRCGRCLVAKSHHESVCWRHQYLAVGASVPPTLNCSLDLVPFPNKDISS